MLSRTLPNVATSGLVFGPNVVTHVVMLFLPLVRSVESTPPPPPISSTEEISTDLHRREDLWQMADFGVGTVIGNCSRVVPRPVCDLKSMIVIVIELPGVPHRQLRVL